jgi:hypothetical protein
MLEEMLTEFGREFFEKATEKVKKAADNSICFEMPRIIVARRRTPEEQEECRRIIKNPEKENYIRILELLELLGENIGGDYDVKSMQIRIGHNTKNDDISEFELQKGYLTHELMHAIRHQAIGHRKAVKNNSELLSNGISLEVCEFFSQLNAPACDSLNITIEKENYPSLSDVLGGRNREWKKHLILDEIKMLKELYCKSKNPLRFRTKKEMLDKAKKLEDGEQYLYFAMGFPEEFALAAKYMATWMLFSKIIINPWQKEEEEHVNKYFEELTNYENLHKWLELDDEIRPYKIARLAIGTHYPEIVEKWPKIMISDAREVEAKYITPIKTALNDMIDEASH